MIAWSPFSEIPEDVSDIEDFLVWCPDLTVTGPALVIYRLNDEWCIAQTGHPLGDVRPTHFARINPPEGWQVAAE